MTEQKPYKLYAVRTADLTNNALKCFEYFLVANNRYALVFTDRELTEPYKQIQDGVTLEKNERVWLTECKRKITEAKIKQNVAYMKEHEDEYSELLNQFCDRLTEELEKETQENKKDNP